MSSFQDFGAARSEVKAPPGSLAGGSIRRHRSWSWVPLGIFAASIVATLIFWEALPNGFRINEQSDYIKSYEPTARNLLAGRGFTHVDGTPATEYPPGYPFILAGIFEICHWLHISEE